MKLFKHSLMALTLASAVPALATEGGYLGLGLGVAKAGGLARSPSLNLNGGIVLNPNWTLGLDLSTWARQYGGISVAVVPLSLSVGYHFQGSPVNGFAVEGLISSVAQSLYLGGGDENFGSRGRATRRDLGLGASASYMLGLADWVAIGPKITYIRVMGDYGYNFWAATANAQFHF